MAKGYLGPAAPQFLSAELHLIGQNPNTITTANIKELSDGVRGHAIRLMGVEKANRLADAIAKCDGGAPKHSTHKLATDAAQKLFELGKLRQAEKAYLELVQKHGDAEAYVGLARAQVALEDSTAALNTLRDGAAKFARASERTTAVSLLAEAVQLVPEDLSAHRRLAAALANQGDMLGAVEEYARFVDVALHAGDSRRALLELAYGRETLGDLPGLAALVDKVTGAHSRFDAPQPAARKASFVHHSPPAASSTPVPPPPTSTLRAERSREAPPTQPVAQVEHAPIVVPSIEPPTPVQAQPWLEPQTWVEPVQALVIDPNDPRLAALGTLRIQPVGARLETTPTIPAIRVAPEPAPARVEPVFVPKSVSAQKPQTKTDVKLTKAEQKEAKAAEQKQAKAEEKQAKAEEKQAKAEEKEARIEQKVAPRTRPDASHTAVVLNGAKTVTHADQSDLEAPVDMLARAGFTTRPVVRAARMAITVDQQLSALPLIANGIDGAAVAASRAALLTGARDARATDAVLDAARRLLALGKLQSASDVLLDYIAHGFTDREAQRLLIEVDCALDRRDVAKEKCDLLSRAYRLDGRGDVAEDVERLARIL